MNTPPSRPLGFTLIELMVTIAIVGVLSALAAPSFRQIILNNRIQAAATEFQTALALARAEAIKRGGDARVTVVANGLTKDNTADWTQGVTVFFDTSTNANGKQPPSSNGNVLLKTAALDSSLRVDSNIDSISFNGLGRPYGSTGLVGNGSVAFGASSTDMDWRCAIVSTTGRLRVARVSAASYTSLTDCPSA